MKGISAYILDSASRDKLAEQFPPQFEKFIGHHVTFKFGASDKDPLPPAGQYHVIGYATINMEGDENDGIEALVVSIDGVKERKDGNVYHITWSHGPSFKPKDSVQLTSIGFQAINPIEIKMEPVFLPFN